MASPRRVSFELSADGLVWLGWCIIQRILSVVKLDYIDNNVFPLKQWYLDLTALIFLEDTIKHACLDALAFLDTLM